jgi:hypothetical protein
MHGLHAFDISFDELQKDRDSLKTAFYNDNLVNLLQHFTIQLLSPKI